MHRVETYRSKTGSTVYQHIVLEPEPCSKSYASMVLLTDYFLKQDVDYLAIPEKRQRLIDLSRSFLRQTLIEHGDLQCTYCSKTGLIIEEEGMTVPASKMATIDHVHPISCGADPFDTSNLVVACRICNGKKSNHTLSVFLKRFPHLRVRKEILSKFYPTI